MTQTIQYSRTDHVARLLLNNPTRHNSLGATELQGIQDALDKVANDPQVRVLVVTGAGDKTFCAGAALNELGAGDISSDLFQTTTNKLAALEVPTICALNGSVYGGGVELALSCDFRMGIENTRMRVPAAAIGLCYPVAGINRFVERLGVNLAKRILVAAEEFDAEAMLEIGFLDHLLEPSQLTARTDEFAQHIAGLAPLAVRAMKTILQQAASGNIDQKQAEQLSRRASESQDLQEGFAAKAEKRAPQFRGE